MVRTKEQLEKMFAKSREEHTKKKIFASFALRRAPAGDDTRR